MSDRIPLLDDAGHAVATYLPDERGGRRWADLLEPEPDAEAAAVVAAVLARLPGFGVSASPRIGDLLVAAGASERRRALALHHRLEAIPAVRVPPGTTIASFAHTTADLHPASLLAFPPGHPDRTPGSTEEQEFADLDRLLRGEEVGPVLPASRVALKAGGTVVGAAIVVDRPGDPPWAGPWLAWAFRHPTAAPQGTGAATIAAAIASLRSDGAPALGLAVSIANPAKFVYERLGFILVATAVSVVVPNPDSPRTTSR